MLSSRKLTTGLLFAALLGAGAGHAVALGTAKPLKQYGRQSWQSDTGLPQNTVHAVTQTPDGFIWMATEGGLVRFDGQEFRVFDTGSTRELPSDSINDLVVDGHGELWIACAGGLARMSGGRFTPVTGTERLPEDVRPFANKARTAGSGGRVELVMPNGDHWVGTDKGLQLSSHGITRTVRARSSITAGRVLKLFADREGALWVAYDLGVVRVVKGAMQDPIDIAGVLSIFEDREGDMWFGTDVGGTTVLRDQAFSTLTTADGLSDDFVRAVFQDSAGTIWLGTNRGGLDRIANGKVTAMRAGGSGGLSSNVVLALAEAGGAMWIGTPDGLSRLRDGRLTLFTTADGLPDDFVRSLYTDRDGSLWIGTRNGLSHYAAGRFTSYSRMDGLGGDLIGSILRARDGALWVGTFGGLSRFDGNGFRNFTTKDGLGGDAITALAEDDKGTLWVAAHGAGITRLRDGVFKAVPASGSGSAPGIPREIYSLLADSVPVGGSLWMGSAKGVYRVGIDALDAYVEGRAAGVVVDVFGVADGMRISECSSGGHPAAWRMADGSLWFATVKGAAAIQPETAKEPPVPPLAAIEGVAIDEAPAAATTAGEVIVVPPGRDRVSIHYAGLSFRAPEKVRFRYKLEGFDKDWVDAGARRTAFYTNLPPGTYRFVVGASNGDGVWDQQQGDVRLRVMPRFYQTWWFYGAIAVALLGTGYAAYRWRVRTVETEYSAVLAERNRIAREIHDTLAQGYVGISVQLELATRMLQVSKEGAAQQLERTKDLVRSGLAEARSSIWNLRAAGEAETLPARLAAVLRSPQQEDSRHEGAARLRFEVRGTFRPLAPRVEDEVLRIAQEAIRNAVRHAAASEVQVTLGYDTGWLRLVVTDDGRGFDRTAAAPGHYGLRGIEERAAEIGAMLTIDSAPGAGTTVTVALELSGNKGVERA